MTTSLENNPRGQIIVAVTAIFSALALLIVVARVLTRSLVVRLFGADDTLVVLTCVANAVYLVSIVIRKFKALVTLPDGTTDSHAEVKYGLGLHVELIPESDFITHSVAFISGS